MNTKLLVTALLGLSLFLGCASSDSSKKDIASRTITIGTGGGFTGEQKGFTIDAKGQVRRWTAKPGEKQIMTDLFTTTPDSAQFFFRYLDEIAFTTKEFSTPGNMTTFIEMESAGAKHTVKWGNETVTPPCEFSNFYAMFQQFVMRRI